MKIFTITLLVIAFCTTTFAQSETLTNKEIILMTRAGLSKDLIVRKIQNSKGEYNTMAQSLIELKKAGVADDVIELMMDSMTDSSDKTQTDSDKGYSDSQPVTYDTFYKTSSTPDARVILDPKEALQNAKTIAIRKSSLHPARQALEKE